MSGRNVFFTGESTLPANSYLNVRAESYEEMRAILMSSFHGLRHGNFDLAERQDGTLVCDDDYFQTLQPDAELVVFVSNAAYDETSTGHSQRYQQRARVPLIYICVRQLYNIYIFQQNCKCT